MDLEDEQSISKRAHPKAKSNWQKQSDQSFSRNTVNMKIEDSEKTILGDQESPCGVQEFDRFNDSDLLLAEIDLENLPVTKKEQQKSFSTHFQRHARLANGCFAECVYSSANQLRLNSAKATLTNDCQAPANKMQKIERDNEYVCVQRINKADTSSEENENVVSGMKKSHMNISSEEDLFDDSHPGIFLPSGVQEKKATCDTDCDSGNHEDSLSEYFFRSPTTHRVKSSKSTNHGSFLTLESKRESSEKQRKSTHDIENVITALSNREDLSRSHISQSKEFHSSVDKHHQKDSKEVELLPQSVQNGTSNIVSLKDKLKQRLQLNTGSMIPTRNDELDRIKKEAVFQAKLDASQIRKEGTKVDIGPFFGLPAKVQQLLETNRGITKLYDWQSECLELPAVKEKKNLIYTLPTSGGKTLVAEVLIMRELLCYRRDAILVLPFVSIVQEKVRTISEFATELGFIIEEYAGSKGRFPPIKRREKKSMYIATIEKAHSLVNSLIENDRMDSVGLVVVDELHMIGEGGSRGANLESMLMKLIFSKSEKQVIGMSATLSNIKDLQIFLSAEVYFSDFRPVVLQEYVKVEDNIFRINHKAEDEDDKLEHDRIVTFPYSQEILKQDPDHLLGLVTEVIPDNSCLMFCPTKKNCENVAQLLSKLIHKYQRHLFDVNQDKRKQLLKELHEAGEGMICPVLSHTVRCGIAYHHSGLTFDERQLIEDAYSEGTLCFLTCTSTLAAGVNLPAKRVILRSPYVGVSFMHHSQYKQMTGRAGRAGIDSSGESILIVKRQDRMKVKDMLAGPKDYCYSSLPYDGGKGIRSLLLSAIGLKVVTTTESAFDLMKRSLLQIHASALEVDVLSLTKEGLEFLIQQELVVQTKSTDESNSTVTLSLQLTPLGKATFKGSFDHTYSGQLFKDLKKAEESLNLASHLHLIFLVTPYDASTDIVPDWRIYFSQAELPTLSFISQICKFSECELKAVENIGIQESYIGLKAAGRTTRKKVCELTVKRFYLTLILWSLWNQKSVWEVAETFSLPRGFIQNLLTQSAAFASCVYHFCQELEEFWAYQDLLGNFIKRLAYCVTMELLPLMEIPGVKLARAKQLYAAGFKSLSMVAAADEGKLISCIEHMSLRTAKQIISTAKNLLEEQTAALLEDVELLVSVPLESSHLTVISS